MQYSQDFSAYFLFKSLGFSSFSDSTGFLAHYFAIFISTTLLLKYAAEKGYAVFKVPKGLIFVAVPLLIISLISFASGNFLMIFPIDASLVMFAFIVAYRLVGKNERNDAKEISSCNPVCITFFLSVLDYLTTVYCLENVPNCYETNPCSKHLM